jgi:hypothetical protein
MAVMALCIWLSRLSVAPSSSSRRRAAAWYLVEISTGCGRTEAGPKTLADCTVSVLEPFRLVCVTWLETVAAVGAGVRLAVPILVIFAPVATSYGRGTCKLNRLVVASTDWM